VTVNTTRVGVRINGGKVHVKNPSTVRRPSTRCGLRLAPGRNEITDVPDVDSTPQGDRCAKCFPGSGIADRLQR